jgi:hypothetical protein
MTSGTFFTAAAAAVCSLGLLIPAGRAPKETPMTSTVTQPHTQTPTASDAVRPFRAGIPETALADLRRRLQATRWPARELVEDRSQGVQLATLRELARY